MDDVSLVQYVSNVHIFSDYDRCGGVKGSGLDHVIKDLIVIYEKNRMATRIQSPITAAMVSGVDETIASNAPVHE